MVFLLFCTAAAACQGFGTQQPPQRVEIVENPTWENAIAPLMAAYCDSCHSVPATQGAPGYLRTDVYETMGGVQGAAALAERHYARSADTARPMPPGSMPGLTPDELAMLQRWVSAGAPRNASGGGTVPDGAVASCSPGAVGACACAGGFWGAQTCTEDGVFTACECGATPGVDTGVVDAGGGGNDTGGSELESIRREILVPSCGGAGCHAAGAVFPDLETASGLSNRLRAMSNQASGVPLVAPGDPGGSYLYLKSRTDFASFGVGFGAVMPIGRPALSAQELARLADWIGGGAQ